MGSWICCQGFVNIKDAARLANSTINSKAYGVYTVGRGEGVSSNGIVDFLAS